LECGFSYIEIIIALALFGLLLMAALPLVNQSGRNIAYAQEGYATHLAAQSLMLAVRDTPNISAAEIDSLAASLRVENYSVRIDENSFDERDVVIVVVWNGELVGGRAVGVRSNK
jgi:prepilin-type N-terminal cleavage/methylation domain-containing protein